MYQVQMTCKCGEKYWPTQKWIHEKCGVVNTTVSTTTASNTKSSASNKVTASNNASNRSVAGDFEGITCADPERGPGGFVGGLPGGKKKQRWDKESYNAYQREYMRRKRK
jgi:hypothetical protein